MMPTATIPANVKTFVDGVLRGIGAPINAATENAMLDWLRNEQGGSLQDFTQDQGNPLGVQTPDAKAAGSSGNLQGGIDATVGNLLAGSGPGGYYANVVKAFRTGKSTLNIDQQIVASPWNGNHYGGITTFLKTAGVAVPLGAVFSTVAPPAGASNLQTVASNTATGCGSKPAVFGGVNLKVTSVGSLSACQAKALLGGLALTAGGVLLTIGAATLIIGGLGSKPIQFLGGVTGVGPVVNAAKSAGSARRAKKPPAQEPQEEAA